ncbi:H-type lectin domain-containing protein [Aliiroseovarius sp. KMU-50]|uniref:H-type lectin domain-containing protein n=1 Tax=Aliiroseovarius salicola TaxID=3009082 RepID=A0ABT4W3V2_9RHOB|nr:H-type lectin domain-containing protein [Aliiroseovarius sp. KMU-50]MDA5095205.1 H-type lectin domain-containing protein [Aliiroseovarius sp. KMU-50]
MKKFNRNQLGVEQGSRVLFSDFEHDGKMWTGSGPREFREPVNFDGRFFELPSVQVSISMWDIAGETNQRVDITAENISHDGFEIVFKTWGDTRVARIRADWLAIGSLSDPDDWDVD